MSDWFVARRVTGDLWMIAEPGHVVSWLYVGSDRALLVDSGTGIVPIAPLVAQLTDRPVTLVNTHYHFDHVGGNVGFAERLAGVRGGPLLERGTPPDLLRRYLAAFPSIIAGAQARVSADPDAFALTPETEVRPFPAGFDPEAWAPGRVPATTLLRENEMIDLGDRQLRVIDTPGHSPDGICLFDERHGVLFAGDTLMEGALYAHYDESSLSRSAGIRCQAGGAGSPGPCDLRRSYPARRGRNNAHRGDGHRAPSVTERRALYCRARHLRLRPS